MNALGRLSTALLFALVITIAGCDEGAMMTVDDAGPSADVGPGGGDGGPGSGDAGPSGGDGGPGHDAGPLPVSPLVDPTCTDGMYTETLPDPSASLADLAFTGDVPAFVDAALGRRYPFGLGMVQGGRMNPRFSGDCSVAFAGSPSTAADVYGSLDTIVHECGHLHDGNLSSGPSNHYEIRTSLSFMCTRGDTTSRGGGTFARSRIRGDAYQPLRAPCSGGGGCDFYADVYLDGDPDNASFEGGDQGFNMLLEEVVQYVNSLATAYAYADQIRPGSSTSARDGILTLLWYLERYLHMARIDFPAAYTVITSDACWRDAILTVWGRAWLYLETTEGTRSLGIDDAAIKALVIDPVLLDEIDRIRAAASCP